MSGWKPPIWRYSGWLIALISGLLLPVITNLAASWLEATFGGTQARLIQLIAILVAAVVAFWVVAFALRSRVEPMILVPRDARPDRYPGLIALVGRGRPGEKSDPHEQAAARAIEYHLGDDDTLKVCWLIASSGEQGSVLMAERIRDLYERRCTILVRQVGDAFSVQDTYDVVQEIYNKELYTDEFRGLGLAPERVIADFTGGTAPMTAGMVLACGKDRPMQYTVGRKEGIASMPQLVRFKPTPRRRGG